MKMPLFLVTVPHGMTSSHGTTGEEELGCEEMPTGAAVGATSHSSLSSPAPPIIKKGPIWSPTTNGTEQEVWMVQLSPLPKVNSVLASNGPPIVKIVTSITSTRTSSLSLVAYTIDVGEG
jgi:hypothetical protein